MRTSFLIVGAGPFGLAMAARAKRLGVDHVVVGKPMAFWRDHMPRGMVLRSGPEWHLDPDEEHTLERFLGSRRTDEPLPRDTFLDYAAWFVEQKGIEVRASLVERLDRGFRARLDDGTTIEADRVLLAIGFGYFAHVPADLAGLLPAGSYSHTCDCVDLDRFAGKRCLIVGGRQSAFEWAALLREAGADVAVCHRHDAPLFTQSDWTWVDPMVARVAEDPEWFRGLPAPDREQLNRRFWEEGRLKLEPWLAPRLEGVRRYANRRIAGCAPGLEITLDDGAVVGADHVVFATGYRVDLARVPFLGGLVADIETVDGFPVLDASMQTSVPGLHVTSLPAARDFGLFFAFTAAVRASAQIVGEALA